MYVLPRLSVARLPRRFPIYFRISPRAMRRDPAARSRNAIRSNQTPDLLSRVRDSGMYAHTDEVLQHARIKDKYDVRSDTEDSFTKFDCKD